MGRPFFFFFRKVYAQITPHARKIAHRQNGAFVAGRVGPLAGSSDGLPCSLAIESGRYTTGGSPRCISRLPINNQRAIAVILTAT